MIIRREVVRDAARLGLVGSVFVLTMVLAPVGGLLLLVAMYRFSKGFGDGLVWRYTLYSLLIGIAGIAVVIVVSILMAVYMGVDLLYPYSSPNTVAYNVAYAVVVVVLYPFVVGSNYFWRRVFVELAVVSRVGDFNAVARWVWYGALAGIVPIVAAVFAWIAYYHAWRGFEALVGV